jgi:hypothetical protein
MQAKPKLAPDVEAELLDARFFNRKHGSRATHSAGCHGPLCRRREALRGRERSRRKADRDGREYIPGLRAQRNDSRDDELAIAAAWHWADLAERRGREANKNSLRAPDVAFASDSSDSNQVAAPA